MLVIMKAHNCFKFKKAKANKIVNKIIFVQIDNKIRHIKMNKLKHVLKTMRQFKKSKNS